MCRRASRPRHCINIRTGSKPSWGSSLTSLGLMPWEKMIPCRSGLDPFFGTRPPLVRQNGPNKKGCQWGPLFPGFVTLSMYLHTSGVALVVLGNDVTAESDIKTLAIALFFTSFSVRASILSDLPDCPMGSDQRILKTLRAC